VTQGLEEISWVHATASKLHVLRHTFNALAILHWSVTVPCRTCASLGSSVGDSGELKILVHVLRVTCGGQNGGR
jgi:hypothetical protein